MHQTYHAITMIRGSLVSVIYSKTLEKATGNLNDSAAITLMSTDVERIDNSLQNIHEVWAAPIETAIGIWPLERQIGIACVVPIVVTMGKYISQIPSSSLIIKTACFLGNLYASKVIGPYIKMWNQGVQKMVAMTSSVISAMKSVKMLALMETFSKHIQLLTITERTTSKKSRKTIVWIFFFGEIIPSSK
jgi:ATP-binding cassette, subfamily C (CFTR/MRP), member 1